MPLTLYMHPLSSYCHKALIALYENGTPFTPQVVDLGNAESSAAFKKIWPVGKFPVLCDGERVVAESTSIVEYLALYHPGPVKLVPEDRQAAFDVRERDRFFDLCVHFHAQKIITDRIRPAGQNDTYGVERSRAALATALAMFDKDMTTRTWAAGENFSMADCAAAPPLFYTDMAVEPLAAKYPHTAAYLGRMKARPSYARALKEAEPFLQYVPR